MTTLLYIQNQQLFECAASVLDIVHTEKGSALIFDQTIFYVQGGGQPSDSGTLQYLDATYYVTKVFRDERGNVLHLVSGTIPPLVIGAQVHMYINQEQRRIHSMLHSAGHMLDCIINDIAPDMKPGKGFHYPEGSYVEFEMNGHIIDNKERFIEQIEQKAHEFIQKDIPVTYSLDQSRQMHGSPLRIMNFQGYEGCPCGGTHVSSSKELAGFKVRKINIKRNILKISYTV